MDDKSRWIRAVKSCAVNVAGRNILTVTVLVRVKCEENVTAGVEAWIDSSEQESAGS